MAKGNSAIAPPVRLPWLHSTMTALQASVGVVTFMHPQNARAPAGVLAESLPCPQTDVETLLLRGLLVEFACRWNTQAHTNWHRHSTPSACACASTDLLVHFWSTNREDPRRAFERWVDGFIAEFSLHHVPSAASRAAHVVRTEFDQQLTVEGLARRVGVNAQQLRLQFREEYGRSIPAYRSAVRMAEAIRQVATTNIEAISREVGYKSRKSFYRAFRDLTSLTPTEFRDLPPESVAALMDVVWSNLAAPLRARSAFSGDRVRSSCRPSSSG